MQKLKNEELGRLSQKEYQAAGKLPVVVVLDNVRSHLNVGSVFRTADAFRIEGLHLCGITGCPPHRDIQKTALGATETVAWQYFNETNESIANLKGGGYLIVSVEQAKGACWLQEFMINGHHKLALVFGNEVDGVQQDIVSNSDQIIEIPQFGSKHSLNVSVAAGVVLWEIVRRQL